MCLISAGRAGLVVEGSPAFWFGAPGPPGEQKRPDAREGPAWAGHEPGIRFRMGAGALHRYHVTTFKWERNYKRSRSAARQGATKDELAAKEHERSQRKQTI